MSQYIPEHRLRYLAERLHALGARPLFELLRELDAGAELRSRLERYCELDPELVVAIGADVMPEPALLVVGARR